MKNVLDSMKRICSRYLLEEKVLIMPSFSAGRQLIEAMTRENISSLNLNVETLQDIAAEICKLQLFKNDISVISSTRGAFLINGIIKSLMEKRALYYLNQLEMTPGVYSSIYNALLELRFSGYTSTELKTDVFVNESKGNDIKLILDEYEKALTTYKYIDEPSLLSLAAKLAVKDQDKIYIVPSNLSLKPLQKEFLQKLLNDKCEILHFSNPKALAKPASYFIQTEQDNVQFYNSSAWLFDQANMPGDVEKSFIDLFQAYGEINEVREVISQIRQSGIPLDRAAVFITSHEPYSQLFYNMSQKHGLPVSFGDGIRISNSNPGKFLTALLNWIEADYRLSVFIDMLNSGCVRLNAKNLSTEDMNAKNVSTEDTNPKNVSTKDTNAKDTGEKPPMGRIIRLLKKSGIGWTRSRYDKQLDKLIAELDARLVNAEGKEKDWILSEMNTARNAKDLIDGILTQIPEKSATGALYLGSFVRGLAAILKKYCNINSELDAEAQGTLTQTLEDLAGDPDMEISLNEAIAAVRNITDNIRIGASSPKPGHLHISHYRKGVWVHRDVNFIIGLDSQRFPGRTCEDAILLDKEKRRLKSGFDLGKDKPSVNQYEMCQLISSLQGSITAGYSFFDTTENREIFPCSLLLQLYRLNSSDMTKDYSMLLESFDRRSGFIPDNTDNAFDEAEWCLALEFSGDGVDQSETPLTDFYENLKAAQNALEKARSGEFTEFDGNVKMHDAIDAESEDPVVYSCSQLETLATCQYRYFLKYVLHIKPPEDVQYDPLIWLDPLSKGTLYHSIFEEFYKKLDPLTEKPNVEQHWQLLEQIALETISKWKDEIPPPNEVVFDYECRDILESCRVFLSGEEEYCQSASPILFEQSFGIMDSDGEESGAADPVPIDLPSGKKLYLRGRIDRVDTFEDGSYSIIDYKTGSTYGYSERDHLKGGRQLQHALYAIALEKILKQKRPDADPHVTEAGYLFPTVKGEGLRIMRRQDDRSKILALVDDLFDILENGNYCMTDDSNDCKYCDYSSICQVSVIGDSLVEKRNDPAVQGLDKVRRLKEYE